MPLDQSERARVKYHLGYGGVATAPSLQFGLARPIQTLFLVEDAMNNLQEVFMDQVRGILVRMDNLETKLTEAQDRLAATQLEELHLRDNEPDLLEREYARWGGRLADILMVPFYPYSSKYRSSGGGPNWGGNVPVRS